MHSGSLSELSSSDDVTVLCVDDDPQELALLESELETADTTLSVLTETESAAATERIGAESVDCVVSDYEMPDLDGLELLEVVRDRYPRLPFVLYTASGSEAVASKALSAGVSDYYQKGSGTEHYQLLANRITAFAEEYRASLAERQERQAREEQFELLVDSVEQYAIFFLDPEGHIATWNAGAENIKGYTEDEVIGEHLSFLYPEDLVADGNPEQHLDDAAEWGQKEVEGRRVRKDGVEFYANATITAITADDEHIGFVKVTRDMSRERYFQEVQRQKNRMDRFARYLTHDLSNLVRIAKTRADMAARSDKDTAAQLAEIETTLNRMDDFIEPLSALARQGEFVDDPEQVHLEEIARDAWQTVGTPDATLEVADGLGSVGGDPDRIQQVFENLFQNALYHVADDVTIRVGTLPDGFYVEDDGPGIPESERKNVFELGFTSDQEGTGFGLAMVKEIANAHGWTVTLTDGRSGGARFEFEDTGSMPPTVSSGRD